MSVFPSPIPLTAFFFSHNASAETDGSSPLFLRLLTAYPRWDRSVPPLVSASPPSTTFLSTEFRGVFVES